MLDAKSAAADIERSLRNVGSPERAAAEKKYLRSDLIFLGASVPATRAVVRRFATEHPALRSAELQQLVRALWAEPVHERRMAAVELLQAFSRLLGPRDFRLIEGLIRQARTWALVDPLAAGVTGQLVIRFPEVEAALDRWATDGDFWLRRSALLALLKTLKEGASFERFGRYADAMLEEREFFIRKAIGWVLREMSKKRPDEVYEWIAPRAHRASGVTMREVVKYLEASEAATLMKASKSRRSA